MRPKCIHGRETAPNPLGEFGVLPISLADGQRALSPRVGPLLQILALRDLRVYEFPPPQKAFLRYIVGDGNR